MLTIRPIGSCRLFTPLKRVREELGFKLATKRDYGFTHTSAEALQYLRFVRGEIDLPKELIPLIARSVDTKGLFHDPDIVEPSAYVIEISSRKHLTIDGYSLQLNYTARHFADFFADRERDKRFFRMAKAGKLEERRAWLETEPGFLALSPTDRELLARIEMTMQDRDSIRADMVEMLKRTAGVPVLVQTHVDAANAAGEPLESRLEAIEMVGEVATELGLPFVDPSPAMHEMGQMLAMEKGGRDLTHFSPRFAEKLGRIMVEDHVRPMVSGDNDGDNAEQREWARAALWLARLRDGEVAATGREVFAAFRDEPQSDVYRPMAGHVCRAVGDFERGAQLLAARCASDEATEDDLMAMLECLFELNRPEEALALGREILAAEIENETVYRTCALSASQIAGEDALPFWKMLVRRGELLGEAGPALIDALKAGENKDELYEWSYAIARADPTNWKAVSLAWLDAVKRDKPDTMRSLVRNSTLLSPAHRGELFNKAVKFENLYGAGLIFGKLDRQTREALPKPIDKHQAAAIASKGQTLFEQGEMMRGAGLIFAAMAFHPNIGVVKKANSDLSKAMRRAVRDAWSDRDYARVLELSRLASEHGFDFAERPRYVGLALYRTDSFVEAVPYLRDAARDADAPLNVFTSYARAAKQAAQLTEELAAFRRMEELGLDDDRIVELRRKRFDKLLRRTASLMRQGAKEGEFAKAMRYARATREMRTDDDALAEAIDFMANALTAEFETAQDRVRKGELAVWLDELGAASRDVLAFLAELALTEDRAEDARRLLDRVEVIDGAQNAKRDAA